MTFDKHWSIDQSPAEGNEQLAEEAEAMLILMRRVGETVRIGDDITVAVLSVRGQQVRVGIQAPKSTSVHRQEIYERIKHARAVARR